MAEHIPEKYEHVFLSNLADHAKEGMILSWAAPGQGGFHHENLRSFEYVHGRMRQMGFYHSEEETRSLQLAATLPWLVKNTNVWRRKKH